MNRKRLLAGVVLLLAGLGCTKQPGPASAEFTKARDQFLQLESDEPTTVFNDPKVKDLLATIEAVPSDSISRPAAESLAQEIRDGIADAEKTRTDRASAVANSAKLGTYVAIQVPVAPEPKPAPVAVVAVPVDAGPPPDSGLPASGMSVADFNQRFGSCFSKTSTYADSSGATGEVYTVNADGSCQAKFAPLAETLVLITAGKVAGMVPKKAVISKTQVTVNTPTSTEVPAAPVALPPPPVLVPVAPPPPVDPNFNPDAKNH